MPRYRGLMETGVTMTIGIAVFNQLGKTKGQWGCLLESMDTVDEVIVFDNGSTDGTLEWLQRFFHQNRQDIRLVIIRSPENIGVPRAYNVILRAARNPYVVLLHNDLYVYETGWDTRVVKAFLAYPDTAVIGFCGGRGI